jgi:uncharacterized protein (TIGR02118 family)
LLCDDFLSEGEISLASCALRREFDGPGAPATYVGMCHIFCDPIESFQASFGPHAKEIMADIANYTGQTPVIQIGEVVVG